MSRSGPYFSIRVCIASRDALDLADQAVRDGGKRLPGARDGGGRGDGTVARRGHQLHQLRERRGASGIGRLRFTDIDELAADRQPLADGVEQVPGRRDDVVRAADVRGGERERPRDPDEGVAREEALEAVESPARRGQVRVQRVHGRPVDPEASALDAYDHRLEVGPKRPRLIQGREIPEHGERAGD